MLLGAVGDRKWSSLERWLDGNKEMETVRGRSNLDRLGGERGE